MTTPTALLTAREAQAYLRCGRSYLTAHADEIGVVRRGGRLLFKAADLDRWNERHYQPPTMPVPAPRKVVTPTRLPDRVNPLTGRNYRERAS